MPEESFDDVCPRNRIYADAGEVCPRERIEADAGEVCPRERIAADAARVCGGGASPIIGIVPTQMPEEHIFRVNDYYINSIVLSGGVPLIMPLTYDKRVYERLFPIVDGFVLTGGQDVDPKRYGMGEGDPSRAKMGEVTPMRDAVECQILDYAYTYDVPLLGICRGMQTMNVYFGGSLYVDLPSEFEGVDNITGRPLDHWQKEEPTEVTHYIDIERGTRLHDIIRADSSAANSFHHQGVKVVGEGFVASAHASDGLVEGIEATSRSFMVGVQWHPEFFLGDKHMGNLFSALVRAAGEARESGRLEDARAFRMGSFEVGEPIEGRGRELLQSLKKRYAL